MPQEIERKFLVKGEYKSQAYAQNRIIQGYISSACGRTVRVRIRGGLIDEVVLFNDGHYEVKLKYRDEMEELLLNAALWQKEAQRYA